MQEESDAQYKNKGKKGSKGDTKSTADPAGKADSAPATASGTSTTASVTDADKDVEMTDAPSTSISEEKKHVGELTGDQRLVPLNDIYKLIGSVSNSSCGQTRGGCFVLMSVFWFAGKYELCGVLTHKGRSADSGHYVSWVKQSDNSWIQFDDDQLIPRKEDEIVTLSGGGDWHMAYLLLYRAQRVS